MTKQLMFYITKLKIVHRRNLLLYKVDMLELFMIGLLKGICNNKTMGRLFRDVV